MSYLGTSPRQINGRLEANSLTSAGDQHSLPSHAVLVPTNPHGQLFVNPQRKGKGQKKVANITQHVSLILLELVTRNLVKIFSLQV